MTESLAKQLTLPSLRAVATVAEAGSVTRAAERLEVTQPALSYQIRRIEKALGSELFERTREGMVPTRIGSRVVRAARNIEKELLRAEQDVERLLTGDRGLLRISSECFTAYHWLPNVLRVFRHEYPEVDVEIDVATSSRRPFEALKQGDLDLVLTTVPPLGSGFETTPLFDDEIVAVVTPDHEFCSRGHLSAKDFAKEHVLVFRKEASDLFNLVLRPAGVQPRNVTEVRVTEAIVEMVKAGLGISVLASWVVQPELESGELVSVRVTRGGIMRSWSGISRADRSVPRHASAFLSALVGSLEAQGTDGSHRGPRQAAVSRPGP